MAAQYKLTYFNGPGWGEMSRLILSATGTPFEDVRLPISFNKDAPPTYPEFQALKDAGKLPFNLVPTLELPGGVIISQSAAIARYLARALNISGATPIDIARLDSVCEQVVDIKAKYTAAKADEAKKAAFFATDLPKLLAPVEKVLADIPSEAAGLTIADVYLYHLLTRYSVENAAAFAAAAPAGVTAAVAKVAAQPGIIAYEAGREARKELF